MNLNGVLRLEVNREREVGASESIKSPGYAEEYIVIIYLILIVQDFLKRFLRKTIYPQSVAIY